MASKLTKKCSRERNDDDADGAEGHPPGVDKLEQLLEIQELCLRILGWLGGNLAKDICALDLTCDALKVYTRPAWEELAMKEFGLGNGKAGYRRGKSLLRLPRL